MSFSFESVMHPGEIAEFQWERHCVSNRIPTTFQVITRPIKGSSRSLAG